MYLYVLVISLPVLATVQAAASLKPYDQTAGALFNLIDLDMNGRIDDPEVRAYFQRFDTDGNGRVGRNEFFQEIGTELPNFKGHEAQLFDVMDIDTNNVLTESDFLNVFDVNDFNSDGVVTREEFVSFWSKLFEAFED